MANTVQNIPVNAMPQAQPTGPVVPNNDGVIDDSAAENVAAQASNDNKAACETDNQANVDNSNRDTDNPVTESKGEDFQKVLERKLSNKTEDKQSTDDNENQKNPENKSKDKPDEHTQNLAALIDLKSQNITIVKGKKDAPVILLQADKNAKPVIKDKTILQQKIVDIPAQTMAKDVGKEAGKEVAMGQGVAKAATETDKPEKPTEDGATKGVEVKQAVAEVIGKDTKTADAKPDIAQIAGKTEGNNKLNDNKLAGREIATAKQNAKAAENSNADKPIDANKPTTENIDLPDAPKAADKALKPEMSADDKPINTEALDKPEGTENLQIEVKTDNSDTGKTDDLALNDQNVKVEKNKATANTNFNYTKAQNAAAVSNAAADAPANTQPQAATRITSVQSVTLASRTVADPVQPQSPTEQIVDAVKTQDVSPSRQINISLNPAELGRVRISFQQSNGEITGLIEVERAQTRYDVEKNMPQIVASIQDSGVQVKRIDVVQDNNSQNNNQQQEELTDQFTQANKQGYSDQAGNQRQDRSAPSTRGSQRRADYQQARDTVSHISDDAISAYA